ncbi:neutral/alkaline non-lysosomal ceramidase N-terminal domain-containing protein [Aureispira anguillae]|uniref:Neutral ceramidase n=1 Tax=Aureispira anguillae TaxID=2864201 RepID=A0A916DU95_9BACT|nr:neutral/alkaline non-lysosomal ceramidase N-terminal domain-containing protein [Aureispira anguillae]BDS13146.1 neutral/alkaline non-lysosomal ceramidase N-terminal domain-containing protein [Aureispira anguillae]
MYKIGVSKVEMTYFKEGVGMLGYGMHFHNLQGIETPQFARAFVIESKGKKIAFVNADFCFSTNYLKARVVARLGLEYSTLGYSDANIMITAQHTHSAAGGYTQHLAYNFTTPGFQEDVYLRYSDAIVKAIVEADKNLKPGSIRHHKGEFDKEAEICFNRSIKAYNQNPEVGVRVPVKKRHLAADRTMKLLRFDDHEGQPIGSFNWFGVHTTSVSNRYNKVCYDNKGYAADLFEQYLQEKYDNKNIVTAFAQDAAGDISPNFIWERKHREYRGKHLDDYESAAYNGGLQSDKAKEIFDSASKIGKTISGDLDAILMYVDMSDIGIEESYTGGLKHETTSDPTWGMSFLEGTTDGQGAAKIVGQAVRVFLGSIRQVEVMAARMSKNTERQKKVIGYYNAHHPKAIVINHNTGVTAGAVHPEKLVVPGFVDPSIKLIKFANKVGYGKKTPWIPKILPLQILIIGNLAIVGVPAEITTIAGARLRNTVAKVLEERGVSEVLLSPYANSYAGYITTYEEYRMQLYEGGHTLFGKWTLAAYQMKFKELARELLKDPEDRKMVSLQPDMFEMKDIWTGMDDLGILAELEADDTKVDEEE